MQTTKSRLSRFTALVILPLLTALALQTPLTAMADQATAPGQNKPKKDHLAENPRHHVLCLAMNGHGACLTCEGYPGETYCIEAASDLTHPNWQPICAGAVATNGKIEFTDSGASNYPARFYRVTWTLPARNGKGSKP